MSDRSQQTRLHAGPALGGAQPLEPDEPFRIAILGDFSGRSNRAQRRTADELANCKPIWVDRDNFDAVMSRFGARLEGLLVTEDDGPIHLEFGELDDFGPDHLYGNVKLFASLRALRRRLLNPNTFDAAAEEVLGWRGAGATTVDRPSPDDTAANAAPHQLDELLEEVLGHSQPGDAEAGRVDWQGLIGSLIGPAERLPDRERQQALVSYVDEAAQATMLALLHHPSFQELESIWRTLFLLVHRLETDNKLKIGLFDISKQELAADLACQDVTDAGIYRTLVGGSRGTPGADPWSVLIGYYDFGVLEADVHTLGRAAVVASQCGAPFVAAAKRSVVGCPPRDTGRNPREWTPPADDAWQGLRNLPEAEYVCLVWPRFMVRLPYGSRWRPIESFAFEEVSASPRHARLLWGNPAMLVALLLGQSFTASGGQLRPGDVNEIGALPIWVYEDEDGDEHVHPCGELLLTEEAIAAAAAAGVSPLVSFHEQDRVQMAGYQSLRATPLAGRWS